jgi:hypothetical protein
MTDPEITEQAVQKTVEYLRSLNLGLPESEIVGRRKPFEGVDGALQGYKGITVSPIREKVAPGTNRSEDIGYGVQITELTPKDSSLSTGIAGPTERRTTIRRAFIHQKPIEFAISNGHYCTTTVEHGDVFDVVKALPKWDVTTLIIRFWIRESRV